MIQGDIFDSIGSELGAAFTSATGSGAVFFSSLASEASVVEAALSSSFTAFTATASGAAVSSYAASLKSDASAILSFFSSRASTAAAAGAAGATNVGLATVTRRMLQDKRSQVRGCLLPKQHIEQGLSELQRCLEELQFSPPIFRFRTWGFWSYDNVVRMWTSKFLGQVNKGRTS
jgi:hypothetical protein